MKDLNHLTYLVPFEEILNECVRDVKDTSRITNRIKLRVGFLTLLIKRILPEYKIKKTFFLLNGFVLKRRLWSSSLRKLVFEK